MYTPEVGPASGTAPYTLQTQKVSRRMFLTSECCAAGTGALAAGGAARAQDRSGARGPIDVHAHYYPESFVTSINEQGAPNVSFDLSNPDAPIVVMGGGRIPIDVT